LAVVFEKLRTPVVVGFFSMQRVSPVHLPSASPSRLPFLGVLNASLECPSSMANESLQCPQCLSSPPCPPCLSTLPPLMPLLPSASSVPVLGVSPESLLKCLPSVSLVRTLSAPPKVSTMPLPNIVGACALLDVVTGCLHCFP
jgi:hypothetical protein